MFRKLLPHFVLLLAFALRAWQLTAVPPGLTHDEAGHGHDAAHVLKGVTPIYFTVGYGREPLFDYFNAGLIAGMGANPFTLRFAAVVWGMIALAATYRVARTVFGRGVATIALALMAASFWPLATSRQILRSAMLPGEMAIAVMLFLKIIANGTKPNGHSDPRSGEESLGWPRDASALSRLSMTSQRLRHKPDVLIVALGIVMAASLYTYIPARALWLMFPLALLAHYALRFTNRQLQIIDYRLLITRLSIPLILAFVLASPLFLYLYQHPEAEQRIGMLSEPLIALRNGDPLPIVTNARETLLAFFLPGHGDHFLAYTISGRPIFDPVTAILAIIGLAVLIQFIIRNPKGQFTLLLCWLALGLAPSFITGPEALTTRIIGAQPVLYILPALGLSHVISLTRRFGSWNLGIGALFFVSLFISTARDYFFSWGQSPDVRAAYQSTLIAMLKTIDGPAVISTVYPSAAHDPYIGEMFTKEETRWVDGRLAMIVPVDAQFQLLAPSSTPLDPLLAPFVQPVETVYLRSTDLDPSFTNYRFLGDPIGSPLQGTNFNDAIELIAQQWSADLYRPGDVAEFTSIWRVLDPARLGPVHPPTFKTDLNLFTHVLNPDGSIFLQQDRLDAPSWDWQTGDTLIQIHQFAIPPDAAPGEYAVEVGLYDRITDGRLTTREGADHVVVSPLIIK